MPPRTCGGFELPVGPWHSETMRFLPIIAASAALTGCYQQAEDPSVPSNAQVARVEAALAKHRCVETLSKWERNYRFSRKTGLLSSYSLYPDFDVIEFHLRRVGTVTIAPNMKIMPWSQNGDWPDSRTIEALDGRYALSSGELRIFGCRVKV